MKTPKQPDMPTPKSLIVYPLTLTYQALGDVYFPEYAGSMLRGLFGDVLLGMEKKGQLPVDEDMLLSERLFFNKMPEAHPWHQKQRPKSVCCEGCGQYAPLPEGGFYDYEEPPRGFWVSPEPGMPQVFGAGDIMRFRFTLCGCYVQYLPVLMPVFKAMGAAFAERHGGAFRLVSVVQEMDGGSGKLLWQSDKNKLLKVAEGISLKNFKAAHLTADMLVLHFKTPTALSSNSDSYGCLTLNSLAEALAKRMVLLEDLYCKGSFGWNKDFLRSNIREIKIVESHMCWQRYMRKSINENKPAPIEGYTGTVVYTDKSTGNKTLNRLLPLLLLGQYTSVGRNIPFGGGQYHVDKGCYSIE